MKSLIVSIILFTANAIPNLYSLKILKGICLKLSGVKTDFRTIYFVSPIKFDNPYNTKIGKGVFINQNTYFEGNGSITIGNFVQVGPNVVFATTNHDINDQMASIVGSIKILDNVWIGANVVLTKDINIGPNVVIGAGSIVTKSFKNCTISGVPAKTGKPINPSNK